MSQVTIIASVVSVNGNFSYVLCDPLTTVNLDCNKTTVLGEWFLEAQNCNNGLCFGKFSEQNTEGTRIQVVEVLTDDGRALFLSGELSDYTDKCNDCCGSTPTLTPITIPPFQMCDEICADASGNYVFQIYLPTLADNQTYTLTGIFNGAPASPTTSGPYDDPTDALAGVITDWSAYGDWTLVDGHILTLTSKTTTCAFLIAPLDKLDYCLTVDFPVTFDTIVRDDGNGGTKTITLDAPVTAAANTSLAAALQHALVGGVYINPFSDGTLTTAMPGKINYEGTGRPITIKLGVTTVGTWTTAACS